MTSETLILILVGLPSIPLMVLLCVIFWPIERQAKKKPVAWFRCPECQMFHCPALGLIYEHIPAKFDGVVSGQDECQTCADTVYAEVAR